MISRASPPTLDYAEAGLGLGRRPAPPARPAQALGLTGAEDPAACRAARRAARRWPTVLAPAPDVLLLDEPTNHLDLPSHRVARERSSRASSRRWCWCRTTGAFSRARDPCHRRHGPGRLPPDGARLRRVRGLARRGRSGKRPSGTSGPQDRPRYEHWRRYGVDRAAQAQRPPPGRAPRPGTRARGCAGGGKVKLEATAGRNLQPAGADRGRGHGKAYGGPSEAGISTRR